MLKLIAMQRFVYLLLLAVFCLSGFTQVQAQCTPVAELPEGVIIDPLPYTADLPQNGIRDTACVGMEYETVFQLNIPDTVSLGLLGQLPIDSVTIAPAGITGVPGGFTYDCGTPDCVFRPNVLNCLRIFGTPVAGEEGMYNLEISVIIHSGVFPLARTLPDPTIAPGEYRLFVRENGDAACQPNAITEGRNQQLAFSLAPNPANDFTTVNITAASNSLGQLRLVDATGRVLRTENVVLAAGTTSHRMATDHLPAGLYTVLLTNEKAGISTRLIVQ